MQKQTVVGIIGVGTMGLAMCQRLRSKDQAVIVYDINPERELLAKKMGADIAKSAREIGQGCDTVLIVVLDATQIHSLLADSSGLLAGIEFCAQEAKTLPTVLICSTIAPDDVLRFSLQIQMAGAWALDAPISGGPLKAANGTMSMMLAGDAVSLNQTRSLVEILSATQVVVSHNLGDAMRAKLVNNLMAGANLAIAAQAMALASAMGLDLVKMAQIVKYSSGQSWICDDRVERALQDDYEPRAQLHVLTKDLRLANQAAQNLGVTIPLGKIAAANFQDACDAGFGDQDDSAMFVYAAQTST
jgi:L-threonate 2-dehydrogenase